MTRYPRSEKTKIVCGPLLAWVQDIPEIFAYARDRGVYFSERSEPMAAKNDKKPITWERTKAYKALDKALRDDLEARGLIGPQFEDQVDMYMLLWVTKRELQADIKERGVSVPYQNGATQKGFTDNKSVDKLIRVSAQMLQIWSALGYKEQANSEPSPGDGEDDEL